MSKIIVDQIQKLTVPSSPSVLAVINSGSGSYTINSVASNPTLTLVRGSTYTFNVNAAGHPFHIQTVNTAYSSADVYTSGVTNPGVAVGTITFTVPGGAPNTLYYVCQNHAAMRGTINIINNTASAFNIPAADGTAGQYMKTDGSQNLGWASMTYTGPQVLTAIPLLEGKGIIGSVTTHTDRTNSYSSEEWGTSGSWTTFTNYAIESDNAAIQFWNMFLGDGHANRTDTTISEYMQGGDSEHQFARTIQFASGKRLGYGRDFFHYDNAQSNAGHTWRVMPVRNTTGAAITVTISGRVSDYYSSGYEGTCIAVFEPNTAIYSTVTSVTGTRVASTQTSGQNLNITGNYTIPAGKTVLVCLTSTDCYMTTYRFRDTNFFYNLDTTFPTGVICDMRMLYNLHNSRFTDLAYSGSFTPQISAIWKQCAVNYGDR
jgi:hypothetical protein